MARPASLLVRARIDFLSTAEGGRASPVWNDYRPNHNFGEPDGRVFCMGFFRLPSSRAVSPGESAEVKILFHSLPEMLDQIVPGRRWRVQEGSRLVAHGTVLEILDNEPRPARASRTDSAGTLRMAVSLFTFVDLFSRQCATAEHLLAKGVEAGGEACLDWRLI